MKKKPLKLDPKEEEEFRKFLLEEGFIKKKEDSRVDAYIRKTAEFWFKDEINKRAGIGMILYKKFDKLRIDRDKEADAATTHPPSQYTQGALVETELMNSF